MQSTQCRAVLASKRCERSVAVEGLRLGLDLRRAGDADRLSGSQCRFDGRGIAGMDRLAEQAQTKQDEGVLVSLVQQVQAVPIEN